MRIFVSDFDGTITVKDVADLILAEYADPAWLEIEKEHRARKIGTKEAISRQFALVHAGRKELLDFVDGIAELDPHFDDFLLYLQGNNQRVEIVSEGLDFYITFLMAKWGLNLPLRTNKTTFSDSSMKISYPFGDPHCNLCGTCKMGRVLELRSKGYDVVYLGDGYSDICPALEADTVFAKATLARLCEDEERDHIRFADYGDVLREVKGWR